MQKNWQKYFSLIYWKRFPMIIRIVAWAKNTSIIGLRGVPIYDVIRFIIMEANDDNITTRANSMAFSFFIALFPAIIFLFTLIPLLPTVADYALDIRESVQGILPPTSEEYLFGVVEDIVSQQRSGLLSFGLILAMFFASNGMSSMISGFEKNKNTKTFRRRNWAVKRLVALLLTIVLALIFITSSGLIVVGHLLINLMESYFDLNEISVFAFSALRWLVVTMLIYTSVAVIYRYAPAVNSRFPFFSAGASLATFLTIVISVGFSYFVTNFGQYNELYGSIGALIVTLLWFNINCFVLLVGFELNASIAINRDNFKSSPAYAKRMLNKELTEAKDS